MPTRSALFAKGRHNNESATFWEQSGIRIRINVEIRIRILYHFRLRLDALAEVCAA